MKQTEHNLQSACIKWFRLQYPKLALNLFAIPNGAKRSNFAGRWYKKEGLTKGVADCYLAVPSTDLHGAFIEFKAPKGTQTEAQRDFEKAMLLHDYAYWLVNDFDDFVNKINNYIGAK